MLPLWIPEGEGHVCRQTRFLAGNGSPAHARLSAVRVALPRRAVCEAVQVGEHATDAFGVIATGGRYLPKNLKILGPFR